ncbi:MAG: hypothetical protein GDA37_11805 [Ekhidna sp.]|nr:hypothetical protein [Ekhidna sp.]
MRNTVLLLLTLSILPGCNDDENTDQNDQILGSWQLTKISQWGISEVNGEGEWELFEENYSEFGITFTFLADGTLTIDRGSSPSRLDWLNSYHQAKYEFGYFHLGFSGPKVLLVKINDGKRTYFYDGTTMILGYHNPTEFILCF